MHCKVFRHFGNRCIAGIFYIIGYAGVADPMNGCYLEGRGCDVTVVVSPCSNVQVPKRRLSLPYLVWMGPKWVVPVCAGAGQHCTPSQSSKIDVPLCESSAKNGVSAAWCPPVRHDGRGLQSSYRSGNGQTQITIIHTCLLSARWTGVGAFRSSVEPLVGSRGNIMTKLKVYQKVFSVEGCHANAAKTRLSFSGA